MKTARMLITSVLFLSATFARADLEPYTDYEIGATLANVTTVKVDSNMIDKYLEGLRATWVTGNEAAKELGQIEDYAIYVSQMPNSGDFNVILVVEMDSAEQLQPSKERYDAFMKKWGEEKRKTDGKNRPDLPGYPGDHRRVPRPKNYDEVAARQPAKKGRPATPVGLFCLIDSLNPS